MPSCSFSASQTVESAEGARETFSFLKLGGEQLYCIQHHARGLRRAAVVLCGSIGAERERAYRTLVDLARRLAAAGFEVLRFDYRGIGESTGRFEDLCLSDWRQDVAFCLDHMRASAGAAPVAVWGVRAGALLACECFAAGHADAMMLCAPLAGPALLQDIMRRCVVAEMLLQPHGPRTTREEMIAGLLRGDLVNVDGYPWSLRLWEDSRRHPLVLPGPGEQRVWRVVDFQGHPKTDLGSAPEAVRALETGERFWERSGPLVPRSPGVFERTLEWLRAAAGMGG